MGFAVSADAHDRFMGRYSSRLATVFADFVAVSIRQRVLGVGCGLGALTSELATRARAGGVVAACVWDFHEGAARSVRSGRRHGNSTPRRPARAVSPDPRGHPTELLRAAGMGFVEETQLAVDVAHDTFEEWWQPFRLGVGPAGSYVSSLEPPRRQRLEERCRASLPDAPFVVTGVAWAARGTPLLAS